MKTRVVFILIMIFSSIAVFSQNKFQTVSTVKYDDSSKIKEYIVSHAGTSKNLAKTIYKYDNQDRRVERTSYLWNNKKGWVCSQKYEYRYNDSDKISSIVHTEWDKNIDDWKIYSSLLVHTYNENGKLLARKEYIINGEKVSFLSQK